MMSNYEIEQKLQEAVGSPLWGFRKGFGTFLTFEGGKLDATRSADGVDHGEWHFWIRMGFWRISYANHFLASAMMESEETGSAIDKLTKHRSWTINAITLGPALHDLVVECTEGLRIDMCVATSLSDDEQWTVFTPDQRAISAYGNGTISVEL